MKSNQRNRRTFPDGVESEAQAPTPFLIISPNYCDNHRHNQYQNSTPQKTACAQRHKTKTQSARPRVKIRRTLDKNQH
jgi:hypothetical protein